MTHTTMTMRNTCTTVTQTVVACNGTHTVWHMCSGVDT